MQLCYQEVKCLLIICYFEQECNTQKIQCAISNTLHSHQRLVHSYRVLVCFPCEFQIPNMAENIVNKSVSYYFYYTRILHDLSHYKIITLKLYSTNLQLKRQVKYAADSFILLLQLHKMSCIGGYNIRNNINRVLEKMFATGLGTFCSWTGLQKQFQVG